MPAIPLNKRQHQRFVGVSLADPALAAAGLREFCETAFPGASYAAAVRELVLRGLGNDPLDAAITAARRAAYNAAIVTIREATARAFTEATQVFIAEAAIARAEYERAIEERVAQRVHEELVMRGINV